MRIVHIHVSVLPRNIIQDSYQALLIEMFTIALTISLMSVDDTIYYVHYENYQRSLFCAMFTGLRGSFGNLVGLCCPRVATPTVLWGRSWMLELPAMLLVAWAVSHHRLLMTGTCIVTDFSGHATMPVPGLSGL